MKISKLASAVAIAFAVSLAATQGVQAQNTVYSFTNADGNDAYKDANNWDLLAIPNLTTTNTALINDGEAVTYTPGGDLQISNGGILEVASGSWTQVVGGAYIQLGQGGAGGNGTILVDGGTFNQGTASSNPFNITGTGNVFKITAGAANFNNNFALNPGLTYIQTGGTVTNTGNEFDFNYLNSGTISGGVLIAKLITGQNHAVTGPDSFNIAGGQIQLTGSTGIYGPNANQYLNFTAGSSGNILFSGGEALATIEGFVLGGGIEYLNGGADTTAFTTVGLPVGAVALDDDFLITGLPDIAVVGQTDYEISLNPALVPEPSTYLMLGLGLLVLARVRKYVVAMS